MVQPVSAKAHSQTVQTNNSSSRHPLARRKSYGQTVRSNKDESKREVIKDQYDVKDKIEMHAC